jgi:hypothetical protein
MPDLAKYLQRMSYLMRLGGPANDVAIYLPTDDAWAQFDAGKPDGRGHYRPTEVSIDRSMEKLLGTTLIPQVLDAGYNFDFIDDGAIAKAGVPYKILIVPGVERISLPTLERMRQFLAKGGIVIATRTLPSLAPGWKEASDNAHVQALAKQMFGQSELKGRFVPDEHTLGAMLRQILTPDFAVESGNTAIGFVHRDYRMQEDMGRVHKEQKLGDTYFVVNTSNQSVDTTARVRVSGMAGEWWDPFTGEAKPLRGTTDGKCTTVALHLEPYESKVMVFHAGALSVTDVPGTNESSMDISLDWRVTFEGLNRTMVMSQLKSWTDNPETEYYSGKALYEKTVDVPQSFVRKDVVIDFGKGEPVSAAFMPNGMRALIESPVRECALVYVNGQLAGSVWHPPYTVPLGRYLHPGENQLRIVVANLAINEMAGKALPTYTLLKDRYGDRFQPQGFENFHTLPAGILGGVRLVAR